MIKVIIFDAYGTLFDVNSAAEKCKLKIGEKWKRQFKKNLKIPLNTIRGMEKGRLRIKTIVKRIIQRNKLIRGH